MQLLSALAYLHARWLVHRDVKPSNLLLGAAGCVKLCDFGLTRRWAPEGPPRTPGVTTLWYRAPEVLLGADDYGAAVDTWAAGCVLAELLLGAPLFPADSEAGLAAAMAETLGAPTPRVWSTGPRLPDWHELSSQGHSHNRLKLVRASRWQPEAGGGRKGRDGGWEGPSTDEEGLLLLGA